MHLDVRSDLYEAVGLASYLRDVKLDPIDVARFLPRLFALPSRHTQKRDARDVRAHYDLSDEFEERHYE